MKKELTGLHAHTPPANRLGIFFLFCFAVLALFIWLGYYVFPIADDHSYGITYASQPFWQHQAEMYMRFSGRFISNLLYAPLGSLSNNLTLYHSYALIHLALLVLILRGLVASIHKGDNTSAWAITLALAVSFIAGLPSPSQGLYWMCGAVTFFITINGFFGMLACVAWRVWSPERWKPLHSVLLGVSLLITMGGSEIIAIATVFFAACAFVLATITHHPAKRFLGGVLVAAVLLLCVIIGAPGNFTRAAGGNPWRWSFIFPVLGGSFEGYKWFLRTPLIPCLLFCALLLKPRWNVHAEAFSTKKLLIGLFLAACALFGGEFLFVYLASGRAPYARINNAIYHSAFAFGLFAMALLYARIQPFFSRMANKIGTKKVLPALIGLFFLFVLVQPNTYFAIRNTINGEFAQYREIWLQRLALIPPKGTAKDRIIDMPAQKTRPFPIVFRDLKEDQAKHQWIPNVFAQFHGFRGVRVLPASKPPATP